MSVRIVVLREVCTRKTQGGGRGRGRGGRRTRLTRRLLGTIKLSKPNSLISKWRRKLSELNERDEEEEATEEEEEDEDKLRFGEEGKMGGENRKAGQSGAGEGGGRSTTELCLTVAAEAVVVGVEEEE